MLNNILMFILSVFSTIISFLLSIFLTPLNAILFSIFNINLESLSTFVTPLINQLINHISFFSIVIRQLLCINNSVFNFLITILLAKITFFGFKLIFKFIFNVLKIFKININYNNSKDS